MSDTNKIIEIASELELKRSKIKILEDELRVMKEERDDIQLDLIDAMSSAGLKSIKTNHASYSCATKNDIRVTSVESLKTDLKKRRMYKQFFVEKLDAVKFKQFAKQTLNETGEVIEGTEPYQINYISIKKSK